MLPKKDEHMKYDKRVLAIKKRLGQDISEETKEIESLPDMSGNTEYTAPFNDEDQTN